MPDPKKPIPVPVAQAVATIPEGVDPDAWYDQVYSYQIRPCAFRRWYADVMKSGNTTECEKELVAQIKSMQADGLSVEESFAGIQDTYVSRAEYSNEFFRQLRERQKKAAEAASKEAVPASQEDPTPVAV